MSAKVLRTSKQNNYYWLVLDKIALHTNTHRSKLHLLFKELFSRDEYIISTTQDMDKEEFEYYVEYVINYSIVNFNMNYTDFSKEILL